MNDVTKKHSDDIIPNKIPGENTDYECVCVPSSQIAELTKTWAGKWDDIQNILEVHIHVHYYYTCTYSRHKKICVLQNGTYSSIVENGKRTDNKRAKYLCNSK